MKIVSCFLGVFIFSYGLTSGQSVFDEGDDNGVPFGIVTGDLEVDGDAFFDVAQAQTLDLTPYPAFKPLSISKYNGKLLGGGGGKQLYSFRFKRTQSTNQPADFFIPLGRYREGLAIEIELTVSGSHQAGTTTFVMGRGLNAANDAPGIMEIKSASVNRWKLYWKKASAPSYNYFLYAKYGEGWNFPGTHTRYTDAFVTVAVAGSGNYSPVSFDDPALAQEVEEIYLPETETAIRRHGVRNQFDGPVTFNDEVTFSDGLTLDSGFNFSADTGSVANDFVVEGSINTGIGASTGPTSAALGNAWAMGDSSLAAGWSQAEGISSSALAGSWAKGDWSFTASGGTTETTGDFATAFSQGIANGDRSFAVGEYSNTTSTAYNSVAMVGGTASSQHSIAIGLGSYASGFVPYKFAIGKGVETDFYTTMALGKYNMLWDGNENNILVLGNGTSSTDESNALIVRESGRTITRNKQWATDNPDLIGGLGYSNEALRVEGHLIALGASHLGSSNNPNSGAYIFGQAIFDADGTASLRGETEVTGVATFENTVNLNGEVYLQSAQGDISMGVFEEPAQ